MQITCRWRGLLVGCLVAKSLGIFIYEGVLLIAFLQTYHLKKNLAF